MKVRCFVTCSELIFSMHPDSQTAPAPRAAERAVEMSGIRMPFADRAWLCVQHFPNGTIMTAEEPGRPWMAQRTVLLSSLSAVQKDGRVSFIAEKHYRIGRLSGQPRTRHFPSTRPRATCVDLWFGHVQEGWFRYEHSTSSSCSFAMSVVTHHLVHSMQDLTSRAIASASTKTSHPYICYDPNRSDVIVTIRAYGARG